MKINIRRHEDNLSWSVVELIDTDTDNTIMDDIVCNSNFDSIGKSVTTLLERNSDQFEKDVHY